MDRFDDFDRPREAAPICAVLTVRPEDPTAWDVLVTYVPHGEGAPLVWRLVLPVTSRCAFVEMLDREALAVGMPAPWVRALAPCEVPLASAPVVW